MTPPNSSPELLSGVISGGCDVHCLEDSERSDKSRGEVTVRLGGESSPLTLPPTHNPLSQPSTHHQSSHHPLPYNTSPSPRRRSPLSQSTHHQLSDHPWSLVPSLYTNLTHPPPPLTATTTRGAQYNPRHALARRRIAPKIISPQSLQPLLPPSPPPPPLSSLMNVDTTSWLTQAVHVYTDTAIHSPSPPTVSLLLSLVAAVTDTSCKVAKVRPPRVWVLVCFILIWLEEKEEEHQPGNNNSSSNNSHHSSPQQSGFIKLTPTPPSRLSRNTDSHDKDRRIRKLDEKNNVNRGCACGGWARANQLEHDLAELKLTHRTLLAGLISRWRHSSIRIEVNLTFQLLMGPYADQVKQDIPFSPESDESISPKHHPENTTSLHPQQQQQQQQQQHSPPGPITNGEVVLRRPLPGRSVRGDPRLVRSLDLELLEEEAGHTRRLLEEERAKNKYLTTLVEDLKSQVREGQGEGQGQGSSETPATGHLNAALAPPQPPQKLPPPRAPPRPHPRTHPLALTTTRTLSPHTTRQRDASQPDRMRGSSPLVRRNPDREPRFPPLRQQERGNRKHPMHSSASPSSRTLGDRSKEREGGTTLPAIATSSSIQQQEQQQQQQQQQQQHNSRRGKNFGRGRTKNKNQQQQQQQQQQQAGEQQQHHQQQDKTQSQRQHLRDHRQGGGGGGGGDNSAMGDTRSDQQVQNSGTLLFLRSWFWSDAAFTRWVQRQAGYRSSTCRQEGHFGGASERQKPTTGRKLLSEWRGSRRSGAGNETRNT
ncbi:hypothetical protein Pcinc_033531 [Petrolisthes cinctipes]|uniref:Uncharacterized protein n=1 Tax=Petrolisthes cinctipes TaxID=88211 RepID=A0AAE1ES43_PETCI|nr:hypothetical protein Pcinc_033531 [Petrolisthes cinctipes]